jgi:ribosomal protein S18 acetylase RimI-like enzyme
MLDAFNRDAGQHAIHHHKMSVSIENLEIVDYIDSCHRPAVRDCIVALQDYERSLDSRLPTGLEIVDEFLPEMRRRCVESDGKILVATAGAEVAGFVTILTKVSSGELQDGDWEYGLVSDLIVRECYRRQGLGQRLLDAAEAFARSKRVNCMRVGLLAGNVAAEELYQASGYRTLFTELEKDLTIPGSES